MRSENGTAVIEFALGFMVILLIALGAYELGTAFVDRNAMANAAREGARAGAAAGEFDDTSPGGIDADCVVIEAAAGALQGMEGNDVRELWIFESDPSGSVGDAQKYRRPLTGPPADTVDLVCAGGAWHRYGDDWPPNERELGSEQWLGVKLIVDHTWKTGFAMWNGTTTWEEDVVMRLEPAPS
jgi:hypothetical protein